MDAHDGYARPPAAAPVRLSRRALFGLKRGAAARADVDFDAVRIRRLAGRRRVPESFTLQLEPVTDTLATLAEVGAADRVLDVGDGEAVEALPYADASFDVVLSAFGAAGAPRAARAAKELVRMLKPGGRIALAAWSPRGLPGGLDTELPPPPGVSSPSSWANSDVARRRLGPEIIELESRTRTVTLRAESADPLFDVLTAPYGLGVSEAAAFRPRFERLLAAQNNTPGGIDISARYVIHTGRRRVDTV